MRVLDKLCTCLFSFLLSRSLFVTMANWCDHFGCSFGRVLQKNFGRLKLWSPTKPRPNSIPDLGFIRVVIKFGSHSRMLIFLLFLSYVLTFYQLFARDLPKIRLSMTPPLPPPSHVLTPPAVPHESTLLCVLVARCVACAPSTSKLEYEKTSTPPAEKTACDLGIQAPSPLPHHHTHWEMRFFLCSTSKLARANATG